LATCSIDLKLADRFINGVRNSPELRACAERLLLPDSGLDADGRAKVQTILQRSSAFSSVVGDSITAAYDSRGNMHRRAHDRYVFDRENRMVEVRNAFGITKQRNVYDATGARVIRDVEPGKETTYIDGIFERERWTGRGARHVTLEGRPVATMYASSLFLIHETDPTSLEICHDPTLASLRQAQHTVDYMFGNLVGAERLNPTLHQVMKRRAMVLGAFALALVVLSIVLFRRLRLARRFARSARLAIRVLSRVAEQLGAMWDNARRRPVRALLSVTVAVVYGLVCRPA
jgi:hypothetical protein